MTKRERAQVVELLRCAADFRDDGSVWPHDEKLNGIGAARSWLGLGDEYWERAVDAREAVYADGEMSYRAACLEAAARVEEGSWP